MTVKEQEEFRDEWKALMTKVSKLHKIGHEAGLLKRKLIITAGSLGHWVDHTKES